MLTAIVDLQFGSTGKGLLAGYLSTKNNYDVVVSANMPNAGHTFVDDAGRKWVHKVLPSGVYSPDLKTIGIGPGAVFDPAQLEKELNGLRVQNIRPQIIVHENAALLRPSHATMERDMLSGISSTMQGSSEAMIEKIRRQEFNNTVGANCELIPDGVTVVSAAQWVSTMSRANHILVEGSQGYSLGVNAGFYPYCTSRDCTVWRLLADCAVPVMTEMKVIGSARVHPIRVGNTPDGYSGGWYSDQSEMKWEELGVKPETTTVTGRERRVATFSKQQIKEAIVMNRVDEVFLNFANYNTKEALQVADFIDRFGHEYLKRRGAYVPNWTDRVRMVKYLGFGPRAADVLEVF